ncbi:MAG TPA: UDP-N-acetylmuramoyl-L-alanine--D-glutamate ligase, partial [Patescibacteria group bacterium]|nr:UDP-N-acetylmuramoyl-L-alanine--D-glutamate ligase [Patescibacteria group bacterium]
VILTFELGSVNCGKIAFVNFKNLRVAIIGLGMEGEASVKYLGSKGANINVLDKKQGGNYLQNLDRYDLIVRSPGVKPSLLDIPKDKITSQTKLFFDLCPCRVIGVTGTKGKGTTASLIYEMLKAEGKDAYLGGNIGKPPFEFLDKLSPQSVVVLELSSFQLQDLTKSPHIAVMLMTTSEHLDWHKDSKEYVSAKRNILSHQNKSDFAIINRDYPASNESDVFSDGKVYYVSRERGGREGCFVEEGALWIQKDGKKTRLLAASQVKIPGKHNLENACAAAMAANLSGVSFENIAKVLKEFKGLEHRLELVRIVNGVSYYDDSFSTTPETAIAAIEAFKNPEILILGGSSKNSDFTELGRVISSKENIKAIIGIGVEWPIIKAKIDSKVQIIEGIKDMHSIVQKASEISSDGDVVLLSPACASFDMFKNYKDRGEQFKIEVSKLS